jgi:hypothetical protein
MRKLIPERIDGEAGLEINGRRPVEQLTSAPTRIREWRREMSEFESRIESKIDRIMAELGIADPGNPATPVVPGANVPGDVLDLKRWKLTLPVKGGDGKVKEIPASDLATFEDESSSSSTRRSPASCSARSTAASRHRARRIHARSCARRPATVPRRPPGRADRAPTRCHSLKIEVSGGKTGYWFDGDKIDFTLPNDDPGNFFKAGSYLQSNPESASGESKDEFAEAVIFELRVSHSG